MTSSQTLSPVPSTSSGSKYLNRDPVSRMSTLCPTPTTALSNEQVEGGHPMECTYSACNLLSLATEGSAGMVKARSEWQRDEDSAFCALPDCTAFFPSTTRFHLLPSGRHHCRMCGDIFCSTHSSRFLPLTSCESSTGERSIKRERVCDTCVALVMPAAALDTSAIEEASGSGESEFSRAGTELSSTSTRSDALMTPEEEHLSLLRTQSTPMLNQSTPVAEPDNLAPIESWMDSSGILSLYPLAARASGTLPNKPPSAAPLFHPTIAERRLARERSVQKREQSIERRNNQIEQFWLPLGAQDTSRPTSRRGSMVRRTPIEEQPTGYKTPEERAADWSSF